MMTTAEKSLAAGAIAITFITLWACLVHPILDGDIWFHLLYGKAILEQHTLTPDHTVYSWTPSTNANLYCAWIGQVIYYLTYNYLGETGVIVFRYVAATIPLLAIFHLARQQGVACNPITSLVATTSILILSISILDKPEILSLVLMTALTWNWFQVKRESPNRLFHIYLFPLLILLWVNTHGIFTFGCVFLFIVGLGETCNQWLYPQQALPRKTYYHLCAALILSSICIFFNPYGYDYIHQLVFSFFDRDNQDNLKAVHAWQSTFSTPNFRISYSANVSMLFVVITLLVAWWRKRLDFVPVLANITFAYFFTVYSRLTYLWVPVFTLTTVWYINILYIKRETINNFFKFFIYLLILFSSASIFYFQYKFPSREGWFRFGMSEIYAIDDEIEFIMHNFPNAKIGNLYNHGSYILWKTWPKQKVMIDARYFPYKEWFPEYMAFEAGTGIESFIKKYSFDIIEVPHQFLIVNAWFANSSDWKPVFYGKGAAIYRRSTLQFSGKLQRGKSISDLKEYNFATSALHTAMLIKDWQGYIQLLAYMKEHFIKTEQQEMTSGLALIRPATMAYDRQDYPMASKFSSLAAEWKGGYPPLLSASLLMQGREEWQQQQWKEAIQHTMRSLFTQESVAATYNLAIMAWQVESMQKADRAIGLEMTPEEEKILKQWRTALQQLVEKKDIAPKVKPFMDNARIILNNDPNGKVTFMTADWL